MVSHAMTRLLGVLFLCLFAAPSLAQAPIAVVQQLNLSPTPAEITKFVPTQIAVQNPCAKILKTQTTSTDLKIKELQTYRQCSANIKLKKMSELKWQEASYNQRNKFLH